MNVCSTCRTLCIVSDYVVVINTLSTEDVLTGIQFLGEDVVTKISPTEFTLQPYRIVSEITP